MTERIADPQAVCPFVALDDDRDHRAPGPDHRHRCFAETPAAPRALAHQAAYCMSGSFPGCPAFVDWARREAAPVKVESPTRSVRDAGSTRSAALPPAGRPTSRAGGSSGHWTAPPPWGAPAGPAPAPSAAGAAEPAGGPAARPAAGAGFVGLPPSRTGGNDESGELEPDDVGLEPQSAARLPDAGAARQDLDAGDTPAFLSGRSARPTPAPTWEDDEPWSAAEAVDPAARDEELVRRPVVTPRRMPVGYAPVGSGRGERRASGSRPDRFDAAAPAWEEPRRFEEYPTLKSRAGARLPRPALYALVILLVGIGLFAAPFLLKGLGGGGGEQASPTPRPSASVIPSAQPSPSAVPTPAQIVHTVKSGDTLLKIAALYGVTVDQILAANPTIKNANQIKVGDRVVIPQPVPSEIVDPGITPAP